MHKAVVMCTLIKEKSDGCLVKESRECKAFHADLFSLAQWLKDEQVEIVAMESAGIYWKKVYEAIEDAGVKGYVVNAIHIKNVPGRKTDINDSEWIAELARCNVCVRAIMRAQEKEKVVRPEKAIGICAV